MGSFCKFSLKIYPPILLLFLAARPFQLSAIHVVCTTPTIYDLASVLGGNMVNPVLLRNKDLQVPNLKTTQKLQKADLIFSNGLSYPPGLDKTLQKEESPVPIIILSEYINILHYPSSGRQNPYTWLDPQNGMAYAHQIKEAFIAADPERVENYLFNYQLYVLQLSELDSFVIKRIRAIPKAKRVLPSSLEAFQYFAERYGITFADSISPSSSFPKDSLLLELKEGPAASTYIDLIKHNTIILSEAMRNELWNAQKKEEALRPRSFDRSFLFILILLCVGAVLFFLVKK